LQVEAGARDSRARMRFRQEQEIARARMRFRQKQEIAGARISFR
jgi:hypothetical protein